jgi:peptidoglycan/LPS O-acetylase OafA/YrhL
MHCDMTSPPPSSDAVPNTNQPPKAHLPQLDVLRAGAILSVFLFHFLSPAFGGHEQLPWKGLWKDLTGTPNSLFLALYPLTFGWVGVALFFVLSGFVIQLSFLGGRAFHAGEFYWRRFWRIYPPYLVALLTFSLLQHIPLTSLNFWSHVLMFYNWLPEYYFTINPAFWSLAVELQFYLLFPVLVMMRARLGMKKALLVTLLLGIACRIVLVFYTDWNAQDMSTHWSSVPVLWFDWCLGAYLAEQYAKGERAFKLSSVAILGLVAFFIFTTFFKPLSVIAFTMASVISAVCIERYLLFGRPLHRVERMLIPLGLCSYSFYLWHQQILPRVLTALHKIGLPQTPLAIMTLGVVITVIVVFGFSWVTYSTIEKWGPIVGKTLWKQLFSSSKQKKAEAG